MNSHTQTESRGRIAAIGLMVGLLVGMCACIAAVILIHGDTDGWKVGGLACAVGVVVIMVTLGGLRHNPGRRRKPRPLGRQRRTGRSRRRP
jgi:uncharacterized membrane protein (UPF0136 family)